MHGNSMLNDLTRIAVFAVYVVISVAGMMLLKGAESVFSIKSGIGFLLYAAGFLIWTGVILRLMPLSQAFPIAAGSLMLGTQLAGWAVLKERVGLFQVSGATLILIGVILVGMTQADR